MNKESKKAYKVVEVIEENEIGTCHMEYVFNDEDNACKFEVFPSGDVKFSINEKVHNKSVTNQIGGENYLSAFVLPGRVYALEIIQDPEMIIFYDVDEFIAYVGYQDEPDVNDIIKDFEADLRSYISEHFAIAIKAHNNDDECGCYVDDEGLKPCNIGKWLTGEMSSVNFLKLEEI